ncbi:MAG: response regulator transcription factor [Deltaproteobacteria bacterium]|jgi:DNA-binding response OmpR family regulator|nr:response regulator transcription factor [Deltaproteobacteria bacterium]
MKNFMLVIDDDTVLHEAIRDYLKPNDIVVEGALNGLMALEMMKKFTPDIILLDVMMPFCDGFEVLRALRIKTDVPVIMLTARGDEVDRVLGLELGADDYLTKPFSLRELLARARSLLRRAPPYPFQKLPTEIIVSGNFRLDLYQSRLSWKENAVDLSQTQASYLKVMMKHPRKVLPRDWLAKQALGADYFISNRSVDVHISHLRAALKVVAPEIPSIQTHRGLGYRWVGDIISS